ncbi:hypothetical protein JHK87_050409 [Glycine soja]|nr:hypothetical protein JHK87_050409 [Glycine soja]
MDTLNAMWMPTFSIIKIRQEWGCAFEMSKEILWQLGLLGGSLVLPFKKGRLGVLVKRQTNGMSHELARWLHFMLLSQHFIIDVIRVNYTKLRGVYFKSYKFIAEI